jgi:hypothetical protein
VRPRRAPRHRSVTLALIATTALFASLATAEQIERPQYRFLRQNEDWSSLADAGTLHGWDRVKYVRLARGGRHWASFGGTLRLRPEVWENFGFSDEQNDLFTLGRLLAHGDFHFGPRLRMFVEAKAAVATDRELPGGQRTLDVDTFDLQQGFVDLVWPGKGSKSVTLRLGRQALSFGRQRLVSPLPWGNTLRSWDGVDVRYKGGNWAVDGFASYFAPVVPNDFNEPDTDIRFYGVYAGHRENEWVVEAYGLGLQRLDASFNGTTGDEDRLTFGTRIAWNRERSGVELETALQFGEVGEEPVRAWMATLQLTRRFPKAPTKPGLLAILDYATGDDEPGGEVGTFNQLFPLGHAYLGIMDFVGRQNVEAVSLGVVLSPWSRGSVVVQGHGFWRASVEDALYNAGGVPIRPGSPGSARFTGTEIDAVLGHAFSDHLLIDGGPGYFVPGAFIEDSGPSENMTFFYAQLRYRI